MGDSASSETGERMWIQNSLATEIPPDVTILHLSLATIIVSIFVLIHSFVINFDKKIRQIRVISDITALSTLGLAFVYFECYK